MPRDFRQRIDAPVLNHDAKQILDFCRLIGVKHAVKHAIKLIFRKSGITRELIDLRITSHLRKLRNGVKYPSHFFCAGFTLLEGLHEAFRVRARYRRKFRHS